MTVKKFLSILTVLLVLAVLLIGCAGAPGGMTVPRQQATWTAILGLAVPLIAVAVMQLGWTKKANSLIALVITVGVAFLDAWYFGQLDNPDNLVQTVFDVLAMAIITYKTIWEPLGIIDWWADKTTLGRYKVPTVGYAVEPRGLPW